MKILNKKIPSNYQGYILQKCYKLTSQPLGWKNMQPLKRIPKKISAFVNKQKITEIKRFNFNDDFSKNQYFIRSNNKYYELLY